MPRRHSSLSAEDAPRTGTAADRNPKWVGVRGAMPMSLPALVLAAGLAAYGALTIHRGNHASQSIFWTLTVMAIALSAAALVLGWYSTRWRIVNLQRRLEHLAETGAADPLETPDDDELSALIGVLNRYVTQFRHRSARLQLQKKELDIQTRINEAQRRCIETVVEKVSDAVLVTDAFDDVLLVNRAAQELFGFTLGMAYRQPIHRVIQNPAFVSLIKSMRRPDQPAQRNIRIVLNNDTAMPQTLRASMTRVVDARDQVYGVVTVLRRIEDAKSLSSRRSQSDGLSQ